MTRRDALIAQLQATHATLVAAAAQVEAQIVAIAAEAEEEPDAGAPVDGKCPVCGLQGAKAGRTASGEQEWVCACGANYAGGKVTGG